MNEFHILLFMFQMGLIDSYTFSNCARNLAVQYGAVVLGSVGSNVTSNCFLTPVFGLGLAAEYIKVGGTLVEKRARFLTVSSLMSASLTSSVCADTATNGAIGASVMAFIGHMKSVVEKANGSCVPFLENRFLSKLTVSELQAFNITVISFAGLVIFVILMPKICKKSYRLGKSISKKIPNLKIRKIYKQKKSNLFGSPRGIG